MIGKMLRDKREFLGYSRERLARKCDVSTSFISQIEAGKRNASIEVLLQIAKALDIDKMEILSRKNIMTKEELNIYISPMVEEKIKFQLKLMESSEETKVPVFDSVSAGVGYTPDSEPTGYLSVDISNCDDCVGIHVKGCSMTPSISDSAVILVRKDDELHDGDIGVFLLNEEAFVKRYFRKKNFILLYSDNPVYQPIIVTEDDEFTICGKVIKTLNNL